MGVGAYDDHKVTEVVRLRPATMLVARCEADEACTEGLT